MGARTALKKAYKIMIKSKLAKEIGVSYQSMDRWIEVNKMPYSEYNGETNYATQIERITKGKVTITDLLGFIPPPQNR